MSNPEAAPGAIDTPEWVAAMKVGHWYRISGDRPDLGLAATEPGTRHLEDGDPACDPELNPARTSKEALRRLLGRPPLAPWSGRNRFPAITEAWNGAVYASRCGAAGSMIVYGGGHNDYFGSDVHAFDLATRCWRRISDGYVTGTPGDYGAGAVYPDAVYPYGSPLPPHTYDYVQYDPVANELLLLKGQTELGERVKAIAIAHLFNLDTRSWRHGPLQPRAILNSGGWTTWDPRRRILWGHCGDDGGGNAFIGFAPDGDNPDGTRGAWGPLYPNKWPGRANHNAMQIDPLRDLIVVAVHDFDALCAIDQNAPADPPVPLVSTAPKPRLSPYPALEYAANLDRLIYYSAADGARAYAIAAPQGGHWRALTSMPWTWRPVASGANRLDPISDAAALSKYPINRNHTFGRFRVAAFGTRDVGILVRHVDTPVYAIRLV